MRQLIAAVTILALSMAPFDARALSPWAIEQAPASGGGAAEGEGEAEIDLEAAKAEYRLASDAYALGNYEQAIGHFERAYQLSQEPALLFDLGQAYTRWYDLSNDVEHLKKARRMYENYVINLDVTELSDEDKAHSRADAQRRIAEVDRRISDHREAAPVDSNEDDEREKKPVHKKAWFWVAIVGGLAVVAAGVTTGVVLGTRRDDFTPELGTIGRTPSGGGFTVRF
ncbi:tetratricopeptide repeat protein [Nannocystaceae bacterium ST9]